MRLSQPKQRFCRAVLQRNKASQPRNFEPVSSQPGRRMFAAMPLTVAGPAERDATFKRVLGTWRQPMHGQPAAIDLAMLSLGHPAIDTTESVTTTDVVPHAVIVKQNLHHGSPLVVLPESIRSQPVRNRQHDFRTDAPAIAFGQLAEPRKHFGRAASTEVNRGFASGGRSPDLSWFFHVRNHRDRPVLSATANNLPGKHLKEKGKIMQFWY